MEASHNVVNLALILGGCFFNNVVLELVIREDKGAGALTTFYQFVFVAITQLPTFATRSKSPPFVSLKRKAPMWEYIKMTVLFFVISVANNKAFEFGITQPFNVIFRSSSLLISFLLGPFAFHNSYLFLHFVSVVMVTVGVLITTSAEVMLKAKVLSVDGSCCGSGDGGVTDQVWETFFGSAIKNGEESAARWLVGVALLFSTLIGLAVLGHMQGSVYKKYKSTPEENIFFSHLLPIPMFVLLFDDLKAHQTIWNASAPWSLHLGSWTATFPSLWILCILNIVTQYVCIKGVHSVTASMGTLTATLATTIRKFLSLIFSIVYFSNPFTVFHWIGSVLVFGGSFLYIYAEVSAKAPPVSPSSDRPNGKAKSE